MPPILLGVVVAVLRIEIQHVVGVLIRQQRGGRGVCHRQSGHAPPERTLRLSHRGVADHGGVVHEEKLQPPVEVAGAVHRRPRCLRGPAVFDSGQLRKPFVVHVAVVGVMVVVEHAVQTRRGALLAPLPQQVADRPGLGRDLGVGLRRGELVGYHEPAQLRHPSRVVFPHFCHAFLDGPGPGPRPLLLPSLLRGPDPIEHGAAEFLEPRQPPQGLHVGVVGKRGHVLEAGLDGLGQGRERGIGVVVRAVQAGQVVAAHARGNLRRLDRRLQPAAGLIHAARRGMGNHLLHDAHQDQVGLRGREHALGCRLGFPGHRFGRQDDDMPCPSQTGQGDNQTDLP